jgi:fructose-bisphosphate aldolase class II
MSLVTMAPLLQDAREHAYAVAAFNVWNLESTMAAVQAAEEEDAPLILAGGARTFAFAGLENWAAVTLQAARAARVPVAVHLDHGSSFELVLRCIRCGFTSVMIDASLMPLRENVELTKRVVEAAHAVGVTAEAELGHVGLGEEMSDQSQASQYLTDPDEAIWFVEQTGVDALAVSVGNLHGLYKFEPRLDLKRLEAIAQKTGACLVMHGGSGTPGLPEAIRRGITKINIGTDIQVAFKESLQGVLNTRPLKSLNSSAILAPAIVAMSEVMRAKIREFGSNGQASRMVRNGTLDAAAHSRLKPWSPSDQAAL